LKNLIPIVKNVLLLVIVSYASTQMVIGWLRYNQPQPKPSFRLESPRLDYSIQRTAPIEVAKVFGRSQGCQDASLELVNLVAETALKHGVDPRVLAAEVAVESGCNPLAVSAKGAVGLTQVRLSTWKEKYDFEEENPFDEATNLRMGAEILASYIEKYGLREGVHHYNGMGVGCESCAEGYSDKVLALAGRK
jgi:hypothetical protein